MSAGRLRRLRRWEERAIIGVFVAALWLPLLGLVLDLDGGPARTENRTLAPAPTLSADPADLVRLPVRFGRYFADHFGFRNALVRMHARLSVEWLGVSPDPRVVLGDEGWLYFAGEGAMEAWRGDAPLSAGELRQWAQTLEERRAWLAARGIAYVFTVAPEKQTVYPEYLPDGVVPLRTRRRLDQLIAHVRAHTAVRIVDLRPALVQGKAAAPTYQRTDTHWTEFGAWLAYRELVGAATDVVPGIEPLPLDRFHMVRRRRPGGDLARMLALRDRLPEESLELEARHPLRLSKARVWELGFDPVPLPADATLPSLVLFRDSFASFFLPYLAEHFQGIALWQYTFDPAVVLEHRPAVVMEEIAERRLMMPPPRNPPELGAEPVVRGSV